MVFFLVGSVPRTDRLGNGPYISRLAFPLFVFDIIHSDHLECLLWCSAIGVCAVVLTEVGI